MLLKHTELGIILQQFTLRVTFFNAGQPWESFMSVQAIRVLQLTTVYEENDCTSYVVLISKC